MDSSDIFQSTLEENSRVKLLKNTVRKTEENELNSCIENVSEKSQIRKRPSEKIGSCFDIVKNENELRKRHEEIKKVSIARFLYCWLLGSKASFIAEISDVEEVKDTKIKQFCKDIDKDFQILISAYKTLYEKLDSEKYKSLEKAKLIYVQEMDKHFVKLKFRYAKKLHAMHEKSKSLSHKKLEKSLSSSPLNTILEESFNDSIEKIYDQYKRQNLTSIPLNPVIGIDLGTTYSCAGVMKRGKLHIISNTNGLNNFPSYVSFTPNGEAIVGVEAKEQVHENAVNTIYDVKRMIGRKYNDINIQEDIKLWPFEVVNENNTLKVKLKLSNNITLYPEELASKILIKVKSEADKYLEFKVNQAVLTVPAYFNEAQRHATGFAGLLAGLNVLQILNEPTAAAIAYSHQMKCVSSKNILIYDLGGSTFDVSVVVVENGIINIKAIGGDKRLGGVDFDQRVLDFLYDTYKHKFSEAHDDAKLKKALSRLKNCCEKAKCELSEMSSTNISIKVLLPGWDFKHKLTRKLFDNLCMDLSEKTIKIMNETLKCAHMEANDINDIVLIGGSTKIPKIQSLLQSYFNKPLKREKKPGETIAYGATIQAALLNAEKSFDSNIPLISDVSSYSSKLNSLDNPMAIIIPSNKQISYQEILDNTSKYAKIERMKTTAGTDNVKKEIDLRIRRDSLLNKRRNKAMSHEPNNYITGIVYKDLNSEYKALENAKLIYVQEMDKHFIDSKFIIEKELQELHVKYKIFSLKKLETELSPNPINKRIEEKFNNTIGKLHDKYKGLNQKNNRSKCAIGIDLGTTYSCVGVINRGKVHIISNTYGLKTIPSYISFTPNGEPFVGKSAKEQAHENPANTIYDVKRMIGRKYNDIHIQNDMKLWPFDIIDENGSLKVKLYSEEHKTFLPEQLSAEILSKLKKDAENFLQFEVKSAVITVPAYFNDAQRQATKEAGILAGLNVLQIINEPTAAAIAYNHQIKEDFRKNVLIYDLGGGTFDVAVVVIENGIIDVKAVNGDTHLGGVDFDQRVLDFLIEKFKDKFNKVDDNKKLKRALQRLKINVEKKKWELSEMSSTDIIINVLLPGWDFKYELTRKTFDDLCIDLFEKTIKIVDETLKCAKIEAKDINDILLIGGSTKIPKIQSLLQEYFIDKPLNNEMNSDKTVAYGATLQAALLNSETFYDSKRALIHDASPFSLGIEAYDKTMFVIIPRNSKIPIVKSQTFQTAEDYIDSIQIQIYEGENIIAKENRLLGNFIIDGFAKKPAGEEKVDITMEIDKEGILHVEAKSPSIFVDLTVKDHREMVSACTTKIPKVQSLLQEYFINKPLNNKMNPDKTVVYGATLQAALLNSETFFDSKRTLIHDVSPFSLGIKVHDKTMTDINSIDESQIYKTTFFKIIEEFHKINEEIKRNIKYLHVFDNNVILVTSSDTVFCCGDNSYGVLGFGHQNPVEVFAINKELCNKQIIDFKNSLWYTFARNSDGKLYCWGNELCSLNGKRDYNINKPKLIEYFANEKIIDYCCGGWHILVLTVNNEVYAWGANDFGQIGDKSIGEVASMPFKLQGFNGEKVKAISCGSYHSMALTENGCVYSWGHNNWGQLGINSLKKIEPQPKLIIIEFKINKIACGPEHSLLLSKEGDIYVFGNNEFRQLGLSTDRVKQLTPKKICHSVKFIEIASHYRYDISTALSKNGLYYVWGECGEKIL